MPTYTEEIKNLIHRAIFEEISSKPWYAGISAGDIATDATHAVWKVIENRLNPNSL